MIFPARPIGWGVPAPPPREHRQPRSGSGVGPPGPGGGCMRPRRYGGTCRAWRSDRWAGRTVQFATQKKRPQAPFVQCDGSDEPRRMERHSAGGKRKHRGRRRGQTPALQASGRGESRSARKRRCGHAPRPCYSWARVRRLLRRRALRRRARDFFMLVALLVMGWRLSHSRPVSAVAAADAMSGEGGCPLCHAIRAKAPRDC